MVIISVTQPQPAIYVYFQKPLGRRTAMHTQTASMNYKNSYKATKKELVSLSVYNVGYQKCDALYQWGPGVRDHYLIHYVISGCGHYEQNKKSYELHAGDAFLVYPNQEITYYADVDDPWEYAWVGFNGSDALSILNATDFTKEHPYINDTPFGEQIRHQLMCIYEVRGNEFEQAVEMTGRLYTALALFMQGATKKPPQTSYDGYVQKATSYISINYSYPITVEDVAAYVGLSHVRCSNRRICRSRQLPIPSALKITSIFPRRSIKSRGSLRKNTGRMPAPRHHDRGRRFFRRINVPAS